MLFSINSIVKHSEEDVLIYEAIYGYGSTGANYTYNMRKRGRRGEVQEMCDICHMPLMTDDGVQHRTFKLGDIVAIKNFIPGRIVGIKCEARFPHDPRKPPKHLSIQDIIDVETSDPTPKMCITCSNKPTVIHNGDQVNVGKTVTTESAETGMVTDFEFDIRYIKAGNYQRAQGRHGWFKGFSLLGPYSTVDAAVQALDGSRRYTSHYVDRNY
jgi:hypothetical protein